MNFALTTFCYPGLITAIPCRRGGGFTCGFAWASMRFQEAAGAVGACSCQKNNNWISKRRSPFQAIRRWDVNSTRWVQADDVAAQWPLVSDHSAHGPALRRAKCYRLPVRLAPPPQIQYVLSHETRVSCKERAKPLTNKWFPITRERERESISHVELFDN